VATFWATLYVGCSLQVHVCNERGVGYQGVSELLHKRMNVRRRRTRKKVSLFKLKNNLFKWASLFNLSVDNGIWTSTPATEGGVGGRVHYPSHHRFTHTYPAVTFELFQILTRNFCIWCVNTFSTRYLTVNITWPQLRTWRHRICRCISDN